MSNKGKTILVYFTLIVVGLFFLFSGLVQAKSFLAPLSVAALLAMVVLPVCRWLESKGIKRGWASFLSDLMIMLFFLLLAGVIATQVKSLAEDWPQIKQRVEPKIEQLQEFIADKTGISVQEQKQRLSNQIPGVASKSGRQQENNSTNQQQSSGQEQQSQQNQQQQGQSQNGSQSQPSGGGILSSAGSFISQFFTFLGNFLLTFIYIFFFLMYRHKFRNFILKMVPEDKRERAQEVIGESTKISQNYLFGRLILIIFLAILYAVGLSISGVKNAILISILAATLSLLPYIGNIIGYFLAVGMAFFSGSGAMGVIGVSITFAVAQFVESYILEPYIVGDKVDLNPVFTIIVVVMGGAIWGVVGMIISIPALAIVKVIFDHIPVLRPLGYLFGQEDINDNEEDNIFKKTKRWALNKFT